MPYPPYIERYLSLAHADRDIREALDANTAAWTALMDAIPAGKGDYAYAPGKWTIKEVWLHMSDTERILAYRTLCIARNDKTPLPGFDENAYALHSHTARLSLQDIWDEWRSVRAATATLFRNMDPAAWERTGTVNSLSMSTATVARFLVGHAEHHLGIFKERYL